MQMPSTSNDRQPALSAGALAAPAVIDVGGLAGLRACEADDLPAVARLFAKTFRNNRQRAAGQIEAHYRTLLFGHPWRDPDLKSTVSIARSGHINGFICALPVRLMLGARPVRAALASSLMVEDAGQDPLAGARLIRSYLRGPQDLSFSDTSNAIARGLWEKLGGSVGPLFSMEWVRPLRLAGTGAAFVSGAQPVAGALMKPFARVADRVLDSIGRSLPLDPVPGQIEAHAADSPQFLALMAQLASSYRLRPQWTQDSLGWFIGQARTKERFGALACKLVRDRRGRPVGCFLYCGRPNGIAFVLQVLAEPGQAGGVLDALLADAAALGCVAVRGRTQPELMAALQARNCVFVTRSFLTYHAKDGEILAAVRSGDALLTGLAGESWSRFIGGFT